MGVYFGGYLVKYSENFSRQIAQWWQVQLVHSLGNGFSWQGEEVVSSQHLFKNRKTEKSYSRIQKLHKILVTGIGRAIVDRMVSEKANVVVLDRNGESLKKLQEALPTVQTATCDVQDWNDTRKTVQSLGPVDHLVNNAGIFSFIPFMQIEEKDFDR